MSPDPHPGQLVLCGAPGPALPPGGEGPVCLRLWGPGANVHYQVEDLRKAMYQRVDPALEDLVDLAAYVYAADQVVRRGGDGVADTGAAWRRRLTFRIPVRVPDVWRDTRVVDALVAVLSFLSEDEYRFEFEPLTTPPPPWSAFPFGGTMYDGVDEVMLFSGGLDSLAGAVREAVVDRRKVLLVNHRSTEKVTPRHTELVRLLSDRAGAAAPLHARVRVNKDKELGRGFTQRTRSFLYVALGATFARMAGRDRLRVYENGVVSLNLPLSAQVVGARASRTTHPRVLAGFARLLTALTGRPFAVQNPFLWHTKADVVRLIADAGCGDLIPHSTSCGSTWWGQTKKHSHCGMCSQCVDRRFAVLAAGQEGNDPGDKYGFDLFKDPRSEEESRTLVAAYLERAERVARMGTGDLFTRFGEAFRAVQAIPGDREDVARRICELYQRHAREVNAVIRDAIAEHYPALRGREFPADCLLRLVYDQRDEHDSPPETKAEDRDRNTFVRRGECWAVRFGGQEEKVYTPDSGFDYLQILVENPGRAFTAAELDVTVRQRTRAVRMRTVTRAGMADGEVIVTGGAGGDEVLDPDARASLSRRLEELDELIATAAQSESSSRAEVIEELERDRAFIRTELSRSRGLGGRQKVLGDDRNRVRNRVCNSIKRALAKVFKYDQALAGHLKSPVLRLGHTISYTPPGGFGWATSVASPRTARAMLHEM